jgi:nucleoside-diphosphate-sugar epimerase
VVAILSHHLWRETSPTLYGYGRPTRDYVHVLDVVRALIAANGIAGVFNIAAGVETDVTTIYEQLRAASGASVEPTLAPLRPGELERSCLDASRARSELGWSAEIPLDQGVSQTYDALVREFAAAT